METRSSRRSLRGSHIRSRCMLICELFSDPGISRLTCERHLVFQVIFASSPENIEAIQYKLGTRAIEAHALVRTPSQSTYRGRSLTLRFSRFYSIKNSVPLLVNKSLRNSVRRRRLVPESRRRRFSSSTMHSAATWLTCNKSDS